MKAKTLKQTDFAVDIDRLASELTQLGLGKQGQELDLFERYAKLLGKWNRVYNLTAIRTTEEILTHHLLDSAALVPQLAALAPNAQNLLDVGSGGGLPAVPVAILRPDLEVRAVDAVGKKAAFIQQVAIELGLKNLQAIHSRVENMTGIFDVVTSRAFASLGDFTRLTRHLLAPDGLWLAMKGTLTYEEETAVASDVRIAKVLEISVPGLNEQRHLYALNVA